MVSDDSARRRKSTDEDAAEVLQLLDSLHELRRTGPASFESGPGLPWLHLIVALADSVGCYSVQELAPSFVNVVELICSSAEEAVWYEILAERIASSLGWIALEEHSDRRVWPSIP